MIVYVFYNTFFKKIYLPTKVVGIYPVYYNESRLLFNIEGIDGKWYIKVSEHDSVFKVRDQVEKPEVELFVPYVLSVSRISLYLIATPIYNDNSKLINYVKNELTVGADQGNSICFYNSFTQPLEYKIYYNNQNQWEIQANSTNVYVNDKQVSSPQKLYAGDYIFCFGLKIVCLGKNFIISGPDNVSINDNIFVNIERPSIGEIEYTYDLAEDMPLYEKKDYFSKAPRFDFESERESITIDSPPSEENFKERSLLVTMGPQITMLSMSLITVSNTIVDFVNGEIDFVKVLPSAVMIVAMLAGVFLWPTINRRIERRERRLNSIKKFSKYKEYLERKSKEINSIKESQRQILLDSFPSLENCKIIIENKKSLLWERNIDDDDFLKVSLGTGTVQSKIDIDVPDDHFTVEDDSKLLIQRNAIIKDAKYIEDVPYTFSFVENNISAVVGEKKLTDRMLDNIFLQIMTLHSYADLKIVVFTSEENASRWEYLRVLPHCWNNEHSIRYFATSVEEFNEITSEIDSIFDSRKNKEEEAKEEDNGEDQSTFNKSPYKNYKPYYLIFIDNIDMLRNVSLIKKILNYRQNVGFSVIIQNERINSLPDQTSSFISVNEGVSGLFTNTLKVDDNNEFKADFTSEVDLYRCAQLLSNVPLVLEKSKYELPKSLTFLQMFNVGRIEQLNSLERWKNNNPVNSLSVPVGVDQNGEMFKMDIHEKVYGPHGLVAGTTGSGKSEWIITYILSLAVNFSPDEVQFVLVDYKGGGLAMSFENKELGIKLPHLAGTITNLDKSAINRSIASLESELKRRQSIFNDAREKLKEGQMDIYKYQQHYRKGHVDLPLSHLLIICDEFAELKQQQPEFMEQLISTSRIGRSLGVHLILATQKPSGVVNDQIWSNSRFKVCLRVQDKQDSNEILKKPDAAYLKQVGAFYLEVGNDEYYNLGQSAWAGAKYYPSDTVKHAVDQSIQHINNIGKIINYIDESSFEEVVPKQNEGEELLNIVKYMDKLSHEETFVRQQLWLENIPENINLAEVKKRYEFKASSYNFTTVIGEYDEPRRQEQNILTLDLAGGNIAIVGQPGCGKEMLLSTILFSSMTEHTPKEINYYILDFGAETLRKFAKFPHVGEVVFQDDMERVGGVIQLVIDELNKRKVMFQDFNGSLDFYNAHNEEKLPLICLVINAFDVFSEVLGRIEETLNSMFRDAPRYGIIFILSASAQNTFRPRVLQYFNRFILMNLQDESQYRGLSGCRKGLIPSNLYGRGICKVTDDDDSYCEFQTARIVDADKEIIYLKEVADKLSSYYKVSAKKIATVPDNTTSEDLAKYVTTEADIPIGYNFYEKDIAKLNLSTSKFFPVITKDVKTIMPFVYGLANLLSKIPNTVVRVVDVLHVFEKPMLDIKFFNEELSAVFAAMSNDVKDRKDTQPLAFNIIVGAASVGNVLDKVGQDFADQAFSGVAASKKNVYILIDDYKRFKQLKLKPWFTAVDTSNGLWLGPGLDTQSLLLSNSLTDEDKKYNYSGMGYIITNGNYTLIKTMMDGDD